MLKFATRKTPTTAVAGNNRFFSRRRCAEAGGGAPLLPRRRCVVRSSGYCASSLSRDPDRWEGGGGGAGLGNVRRQDAVSLDEDDRGGSLFRHVRRPKTVSVIGAPMTYGQPFVGTDSGPTILRETGILQDLASLGWRVEDLPDLDFETICRRRAGGGGGEESDRPLHPNAKHSHEVGAGASALADVVEEKIREGRFPLILGGDHSIGIGSLAGLLRARPETGVVWVDAHADLNTPDVSGSGNMHGMPLGLLMEGLVPDRGVVPGLEWLEEGNRAPRLRPDSIVYVGLRDVDRAEREFIRRLNIRAYTMHDVDRLGIGRVMDLAMGHLLDADPDRPLHVSYDIDAVDPLHAPATGTAVRGGLTWREAHYVAEAIAGTGALASAEIVELNPTLSDGQGASETVELGRNLVRALLGDGIL